METICRITSNAHTNTQIRKMYISHVNSDVDFACTIATVLVLNYNQTVSVKMFSYIYIFFFSPINIVDNDKKCFHDSVVYNNVFMTALFTIMFS